MKKSVKKTEDQIKAEAMKAIVKDTLVEKLHEDDKSVEVKHVFDNRFRANVWKEGRIHKSFFIHADKGGIVKSDPEIR